MNETVVLENVSLTELDFISSPYIKGSLYHAAKSITVYGFLLDFTIDIEVDTTIIFSFPINVPHPDGVVIYLPTVLLKDQEVRIRQRNGEIKSEWSDPVKVIHISEDYPLVPPRPKINSPIFECSSRTYVSNLIQGGYVRILSEDNIIGSVAACKESQSVDVYQDYTNNQKIRAESELGFSSYPSVEHTVTLVSQQELETPTISPVYENARYILVENVVNGASIHLLRNDLNATLTFKCGSDKCFIPLENPLQAGEQISVWQSLCLLTSSKATTIIQDCSLMPPPEVGPVQVGDNSISITNYIYGATIIVYINQTQVGKGGGPKIPLNKTVECDDIIHVQQILGQCKGNEVLQIKPLLVNPHIGEDLLELDFYPVGISLFLELSDGPVTETFGSESEEPAGIIYYPAEEDGWNKSFNKILASRGPVPIVFIAHGIGHNYRGYEYFQEHLAKIGIVSVSVRFCTTSSGIVNIEQRADQLLNAVLRILSFNEKSNSRFFEKIDFQRMGFLGHSRGAEAVIMAANYIIDGALTNIHGPDPEIKGVVSLAPSQEAGDAEDGELPEEQYLPRGYDFMTILPHCDEDVFRLNGAIFYDNAKPKHFKCQLFVCNTAHNPFHTGKSNPQFGGPYISERDHQRILSTYCSAFFRAVLRREDTLPYLTGHMIPKNVPADKIHLSFEFEDSLTIDNYEENNTIELNSLNLPNQHNIPVDEHLLKYDNSEFPDSTFVGYSTAMVIELQPGVFQWKLPDNTDISGKEVWIRVAEATNQTGQINIDLGLQDDTGEKAWIESDEILPIPKDNKNCGPYVQRGLPSSRKGKRVLNTIRYPASCFQCKNNTLNIHRVEYILLRHKVSTPEEIVKVAIDDLQIVRVRSRLSMIPDLPIDIGAS